MTAVFVFGSIALAGVACATMTVSAQDSAGTRPPTQESVAVGVRSQIVPEPAPAQPPSIASAPLQAPERLEPLVSGPEIVCGIKTWRVNPKFDSGIQIPIPERVVAAARIRRIPAPSCVGSAASVYRPSLPSEEIVFKAPEPGEVVNVGPRPKPTTPEPGKR